MPEPSAFDLARLLLPEPRGRLIVIGCHPALELLREEPWDEVRILDAGNRAGGNRADALLFAGGDPRAAATAAGAELPVAAILRGRVALGSIPGNLVRDAFPMSGRPLLWRAPGSPGRPSQFASPRGRLDLLLLDLWWLLEPLRRIGQGWSVAADRRRALICRLLDAAGLPEADWQQTRTGSLVAIGAEKVLKIPIDRVEPGHFASQNRQLDRLRRTVVGKPIARLFPANQEELCVGGWFAGLEPRLPGRSALRWLGRRNHLDRIFRSGARFLETWYSSAPEARPVDEGVFRELWENPLAPLATALASEGEGGLWQAILAPMKARAIGRPLSPVPRHGDFWLNNLLVDEKDLSLTGVVDWDRATSRGLPLLDLLHLLNWRTRLLTPDLSSKILEGFLRDGGGARAPLIREHCRAIGLDPAWVRDLFCRYWLGQIAQRADEFFPGRSALPGLIRITEFFAR